MLANHEALERMRLSAVMCSICSMYIVYEKSKGKDEDS